MPRPSSSPRPPRYDAALACRQISASDPKLARLIQRAGPFTMRVASAQSPFEALVESIIRDVAANVAGVRSTSVS